MNNDYVPLGWTETEYKTDANYNPHGLNNDKTDNVKTWLGKGPAMEHQGAELDFGEATIHDFRLANNEVVYGD